MNIFDKAYAEAKEDMRKLKECEGPHNFVPTIPDKISSDHRCTKCGGRTRAINVVWYKKGLEHGAKNRM